MMKDDFTSMNQQDMNEQDTQLVTELEYIIVAEVLEAESGGLRT